MNCLKVFAGYRQVLKALPKAIFITDFNQLNNAQCLAHAIFRLYVRGYCQSANDVLEKGHNCFRNHKDHPHVGIAAQAGLYRLLRTFKSYQLEGRLVGVHGLLIKMLLNFHREMYRVHSTLHMIICLLTS